MATKSIKKPTKKKPRAAPKPKPIEIKYILKKNEHLWFVLPTVLDALPVEEATRLAIIARTEQRNQLLWDAQNGETKMEDTIIINGLENSLDYLKNRFPSITSQLKLYEPKIGQS
jgi:hypothetical protein